MAEGSNGFTGAMTKPPSRTRIFLSLAAIAAVCLAWFLDRLAWYFAVPLILCFLVQFSQAPTGTKHSTTASPSVGPLPATFRFSYMDRDGSAGTRTVDVRGISHNDGATYLEGYCHARNAERTFRTDRIRGPLMDTGTGEIVPVADLLSQVHQRTTMAYKPAKEWQTAVLFIGFTESKRDELEELASAAGWDVRSTVGSTLDYLVTGPRAGSSKVAQAEELGVSVIDEELFRALV